MLLAIPINHQTWLICGGRDYNDKDTFNNTMGDLVKRRGMPSKIVQGGASGADKLAKEWAIHHAIDSITVAADWGAYGRAAGPIRNKEMLDRHKPDLVISFPGGKGTDSMKRLSREAGIDVAEIEGLPR